MKDKSIVVYFPEGNPGADVVLREFLGPKPSRGISGARRQRSFRTIRKGQRWSGTITYGNDKSMKILVCRQMPANRLPDWCVSSSGQMKECNGPGHFSIMPKKTSSIAGLPSSRRHLVMHRRTQNSPKSAANQLTAEITGGAIVSQGFVSYPGGHDGPHQKLVAEWLNSQVPIQLVSAICLHADAARKGIAKELDDGLLDLLVRVAKASFETFPGVSSWAISTFGPNDYRWLGDLGITKVLLPYMWDAPAETVIADLAHNFRLTEGLVAKLNAALPFPVTCHHISDGAPAVDIDALVVASRERAETMMPGLMASPPAIFNQLPSYGDRLDRVQQEAFLYLFDTLRYGQVDGDDRPATLYVGLEVHGGYWAHGNLFYGPNREFLPIGWLPQAVRQHWASWVLRNATLGYERQRIEARLRHCGY